MQALSPHLQHFLAEYRLCTPRDLRRCRRRVRRLTRDLPAFDSVWIDALVQAGRLTAFQAGVLESGQPQRLGVGPCVLREQLGNGPAAVTYLAQQRDGQERVVLKMMSVPTEQRAETHERMQTLTSFATRTNSPHLVLPHACLAVDDQLVAISHVVEGPTLRELLIRRGRWPANAVAALGRQLLSALAACEELGIAHGEISPENCRLSRNGVATLVDAGVRSAMQPALTIHALAGSVDPERYNGIAPERIGSGQPADLVSDLYALGCLLWQLLAGRPPFPTGDPLGKLVAHQTKRLADVRDFAPDTPAWLAEALLQFTMPDPSHRPQSIAAVSERWACGHWQSKRALASFRHGFEQAVPLGDTGRGPKLQTVAVTAVLLLAVAAGYFRWHPQGRTQWQAWTNKTTAADASAIAATDENTHAIDGVAPTEDSPARRTIRDAGVTGAGYVQSADASTNSTQQLLQLPAPDRFGVIELTAAGPYQARRVEAVGALTLQAAAGVQPVIVVTDTPLEIVAEQLVVRGVHFEQRSNDNTNRSEAHAGLLAVAAQRLHVERCRFSTNIDANAVSKTAGVAWRSLDATDSTGSRLQFVDVFWTGALDGVRLYSPLRNLTLQNVLHTGRGALVVAQQAQPDAEILVRQVTLRDSGPLLEFRTSDVAKPQQWSAPMQITTENCAFSPRADSALVVMPSEAVSGRVWSGVVFRGQGSLLTAAVPLAGRRQADRTTLIAEPTAMIAVEGLALGKLEFVGVPADDAQSGKLTNWQGPRRSSGSLGVDVSRLH